MSAIRVSLIACAALAASSLYATGASATAQSFVALLYGGNEVDSSGYANAGDPNGYGIATVSVVSRRKVCFTLFVKRIDKPQSAHIHAGAAGVNGGVVIPLAPVPGSGKAGVSSACVKGSRRDVKAIGKNPDAFYINVHTNKYPAGAVRGQLF